MRALAPWTCILVLLTIDISCSDPEPPYLSRQDKETTTEYQGQALPKKPIALTSENFSVEVLNSATPVLVDFWAPWAGPARMLAPILDELYTEYHTILKVAKVNVDEYAEIAMEYEVDGVPTLVLFNNGREVGRLAGAHPKSSIEELVNRGME